MHFADSEDPHVAVGPRYRKHGVIVREVHCANLPRQVINRTERLVIVALVKQLHLVRKTASSYYHVLVLLAELAGVQETRSVRHLQTLPVDRLVQLALPGLPLLQLVALPPRSRQQVHSTVRNTIPADIRAIDTHKGLPLANIPGDKGLVPTSRVDKVLILRIAVKLGAVNSVGMAIMRGVRLLEFYCLFALDFVVDPNNWFAAGSQQFRSIDGVVETVELLVDDSGVVLDGGE